MYKLLTLIITLLLVNTINCEPNHTNNDSIDRIFGYVFFTIQIMIWFFTLLFVYLIYSKISAKLLESKPKVFDTTNGSEVDRKSVSIYTQTNNQIDEELSGNKCLKQDLSEGLDEKSSRSNSNSNGKEWTPEAEQTISSKKSSTDSKARTISWKSSSSDPKHNRLQSLDATKVLRHFSQSKPKQNVNQNKNLCDITPNCVPLESKVEPNTSQIESRSDFSCPHNKLFESRNKRETDLDCDTLAQIDSVIDNVFDSLIISIDQIDESQSPIKYSSDSDQYRY